MATRIPVNYNNSFTLVKDVCYHDHIQWSEIFSFDTRKWHDQMQQAESTGTDRNSFDSVNCTVAFRSNVCRSVHRSDEMSSTGVTAAIRQSRTGYRSDKHDTENTNWCLEKRQHTSLHTKSITHLIITSVIPTRCIIISHTPTLSDGTSCDIFPTPSSIVLPILRFNIRMASIFAPNNRNSRFLMDDPYNIDITWQCCCYKWRQLPVPASWVYQHMQYTKMWYSIAPNHS
jgi:hypothetical protein